MTPKSSIAGVALAACLGGCGGGARVAADGGGDAGADAGADAGSDAGAGADADGGTGAADADAGGIAVWAGTVAWPMPNPAASGLPNPASYDTSAPGLVLDRVTGLGWQRDVGAGTYLWSDALAACAALSLGGADAGAGSWRLPSLLELVSIVDFSRAGPAADPDAFPDTPADSFWTSTPVAGSAGDAWYVNFSTGFSYQGHQAFLPLLVRCVRTQTALAAQPGLTWQVAESDGIFTFDEAAQYCQGRGGGAAAAGWRLPSMKELQSIVDVTRTDPALAPAAFPGASSFPLWTSSPLAGSTSAAWTVDFFLGAAASMDRSSTFRARCVR